MSKGRSGGSTRATAKALPGVLEVFTHENTKGLNEVPFSTSGGGATHRCRNGAGIFHDGQIVGMAVADTYEAAQEAASLVEIEYEVEKASATFGSTGVSREDASKASVAPRNCHRRAMPTQPSTPPR